mmetsp:Transcript_276/g.675  ORF Transcript_276/g.675 Transcript_276/m.675 type:complete len:211 (+) Transcript_276:352-984(+)
MCTAPCRARSLEGCQMGLMMHCQGLLLRAPGPQRHRLHPHQLQLGRQARQGLGGQGRTLLPGRSGLWVTPATGTTRLARMPASAPLPRTTMCTRTITWATACLVRWAPQDRAASGRTGITARLITAIMAQQARCLMASSRCSSMQGLPSTLATPFPLCLVGPSSSCSRRRWWRCVSSSQRGLPWSLQPSSRKPTLSLHLMERRRRRCSRR